MSSYYTTAQLEAMRKEKLRKRLNESIDFLRNKLSECTSNDIGAVISFGTVHTKVIEDEISSGFEFKGEISNSIPEGTEISEREKLDLSSLLSVGNKKADKMNKLRNSIEKIKKRAILYIKDENERLKIENIVKQIVVDSSLDLDSKIEIIDMKVEGYIRSGILVENVDVDYVNSRFMEYRTLCEMLEIQPTEKLLERVELKCNELRAKLQKQEEEKYIAETISDIMKELGCSGMGSSILQNVEGEMFEIEGYEYCNIFIGKQEHSVLFEPVIHSREGSVNHKKRVQADIDGVCSFYAEVARRAAERGVILTKVDFEPVLVETATVSEKVQSGYATKKRKQQQKKLIEKQWGDN